MEALLIRLFYFALINAVLILLGFVCIRQRATTVCWLMFMVSIGSVYLIFIDAYPIIRMLTIIATTFTAMKVIAVTEGYKSKSLTLSFKQWVVYAVG